MQLACWHGEPRDFPRNLPIACDKTFDLSGPWHAALGGINISATMPGDLITDLHRAGLVGDPLRDVNFRNSSLWGADGWTYTTWFAAPAAAAGGEVLLVFDSVKMGAVGSLNGVTLGEFRSQFIRYSFPVGSDLQPWNRLDVRFDSREVDVGGRYMPCTGGMDWAPYTTTNDGTEQRRPTFSRGLVGHVYLARVAAASAAIEHVVPHVFYRGAYPTAPLADGAFGAFEVRVRAHFSAAAAAAGVLRVEGEWGAAAEVAVSLPPGASNATLTLSAASPAVRLWWPNGLGGQPLYNVSASFVPRSGGAAVRATRRVGFRVAHLVTGNDTDAAWVARAATLDGSGGPHTMMLRVNGAPLLALGANFVPMEQLEGRSSVRALRNLVASVARARFTVVRVWGGGTYAPDLLYDEFDAAGIVVYHDLMYHGSHQPTADAVNAAELRHAARRLSAHPCIVLWSGCNECGGGAGPVSAFALPVIAAEDASRAVWPAAPAHLMGGRRERADGAAQRAASVAGRPFRERNSRAVSLRRDGRLRPGQRRLDARALRAAPAARAARRRGLLLRSVVRCWMPLSLRGRRPSTARHIRVRVWVRGALVFRVDVRHPVGARVGDERGGGRVGPAKLSMRESRALVLRRHLR